MLTLQSLFAASSVPVLLSVAEQLTVLLSPGLECPFEVEQLVADTIDAQL